MKLGYVGSACTHAVINHTRDVTLGKRDDTEAIIYEGPEVDLNYDLPGVNSCDPVRALVHDDELLRKFNKLYQVTDNVPTNYLYGFVYPDSTSEFIEMSYSTRFMVGDIGPNVGFVKGSGLRSVDHHMAVPDFSNLIEGVQALGYTGEITVGIDEAYSICTVMFGHFLGGFALFNELAKSPMEKYYAACLGQDKPKGLHDAVSVVNLMSCPPFPIIPEGEIQIPPDADNHVYRMKFGKAIVAYAAAWGTSIHEAKRRVRLTLDNCSAVNTDLQYRVDYGYKESFVLSADRWDHLGGVKPRS